MVRNEIKRCYICQISRPNEEIRQCFALQLLPKTPGTHIAFDICCGLEQDQSTGSRYIYVADYQYSNYTIASAAKFRSVVEVLDFFCLAIFAYTMPINLLLDGEIGLLQSKEFNNFLSLYNIHKQRTSVAKPQSNGQWKRINYFVKKSIRTLSLLK